MQNIGLNTVPPFKSGHSLWFQNSALHTSCGFQDNLPKTTGRHTLRMQPVISANFPLFTGPRTEQAAGLVHLDARWYNPHSTRFVQPDLWNFVSTGLPKEIQHEVMQFTGLNSDQLLRDPGQQMRYGYVESNPVSSFDYTGLETQGISVNWSAGWGAGATGGFNLVWDDKANVNLQVVWGAGGDTPGASLTAGTESTTADTINELTGQGGQAGVDAGLGVTLDSGTMSGPGYTGTYSTAGISVGTPIGNSGYITDTRNVFGGFNFVDDVINPVKSFIGDVFNDC